MAKFISFFSFLLIFVIKTSYSNELVLALHADEQTKTSIYQTYVTRTGLHKATPDNYHVTVGWVKNIDKKDYRALKEFMGKKLAAYKKNLTLGFQAGHAGSYLVGGRTPEASPIVLYPHQNTVEQLKVINASLLQDLQSFKSPSGKKISLFSRIDAHGVYASYNSCQYETH